MNIQSMEYVIALSKTLNFTKAAAAMCTTQPAFSRVISSVEEELGIAIFERSRRYVRLTPAGELLVSQLEQALKLYEDGVRLAQEVSENYSGKLRIGFIPDTINQDIRLLSEEFGVERPDIRISLRETHYYELQNQLLTDELDAVIYTSMQTGFSDEFEYYPLFETPLCAIVNESHPLAGRDSILASELKSESFVVLAHDITMSGSWSFVHRFASAHNFTPHIAEHASMLSSVLLQVSCGKGIGIASQFAGHLAPENVRIIPIDGSGPCVRYALWSRTCKNPVLSEFVECIRHRFPLHV